ncbi:MAG: hypothetical protein AAB875_00670 [Patescibacteria group bacterium]
MQTEKVHLLGGTLQQKFRNHKFSERSRIVIKRWLTRPSLRPLVYGLLLIQTGCETYLAFWGGVFVRLALAYLFYYAFVHLAGMAREILRDWIELRKSGKVSMETLIETVKPDFAMMGLYLTLLAIPTVVFLRWATIQNLINQLFDVATTIPQG